MGSHEDEPASAAGAAWSEIAGEWAQRWGRVADPARRTLVRETGVGPGSRVLDVGAGSGEFAALLLGEGASVAAIDAAPGMVDLARRRAPGADVRLGSLDALPWPDGSFDVVTAINALQFAGDPIAALRELARVVGPGGAIGVSNWAEAALNDLDAIEAELARDDGDDPESMDDPDYRLPGGLEAQARAAGLEVTGSGVIDLVWEPQDDHDLVRGVLLGEDEDGLAARRDVVLRAAARFRRPDVGGYRLHLTFRYVIARRPGEGRG